MKHLYKLLLLLLALTMVIASFTACDISSIIGGDGDDTSNTDENKDLNKNEPTPPAPWVDYVSGVKFDANSGRVYAEVTVKIFVDGDTTHFNVDKSISETGVLKARYLAVDTPESTGQIEPWGKKASNFTKSKLSEATSIIIESDTAKWEHDSTGERYLVWVWYKTADSAEYRNLNLELLQEGLSKGSKSSNNSYCETASSIVAQSLAYELNVFSKGRDPEFYYGNAHTITLKELKLNIEKYKETTVSFEGVVVKNAAQTAYIEEYDEVTGTYFGIQVYYGYNLNSFGLSILSVGNRVRIVGSVQYYETGGTYQISDIKYNAMIPDHEDNVLKISSGNAASYREVDVPTLLSGKLSYEVTIKGDDGSETTETKTLDYGFVGMHSSASMKNLTIKDVYTTKDGSSKGAMSITCEDENGNEVVLRTIVLKDAETGATITEDAFPVGSVIDAKGIIDVFDGEYQLKIFSELDITFHSTE